MGVQEPLWKVLFPGGKSPYHQTLNRCGTYPGFVGDVSRQGWSPQGSAVLLSDPQLFETEPSVSTGSIFRLKNYLNVDFLLQSSRLQAHIELAAVGRCAVLEQRRDAEVCEGFLPCPPNFPFPKHNITFCTHSRTRSPEMGLSLA